MNLSGYKTYITAVVAIITAIGAYLSGDVTIVATVQSVFVALLAAFIRHGVATSAVPAALAPPSA